MPAPNTATITTSLERSLHDCSLNHQRNGGEADGRGKSSSSDEIDPLPPDGDSDVTVELNSHLSLPFDWEQCLDLKTGEVYYLNWRNGVKTREDPRRNLLTAAEYGADLHSEDDDDSSFESEESSSESCISYSGGDKGQHYSDRRREEIEEEEENVLVVAGCKSCFMYFMVLKGDENCPKCCGRLLHFDRPVNGSP